MTNRKTKEITTTIIILGYLWYFKKSCILVIKFKVFASCLSYLLIFLHTQKNFIQIEVLFLRLGYTLLNSIFLTGIIICSKLYLFYFICENTLIDFNFRRILNILVFQKLISVIISLLHNQNISFIRFNFNNRRSPCKAERRLLICICILLLTSIFFFSKSINGI